MNVHKNARLTPHGRERIIRQVESGQTPKAVGEAAGVCPRTVRKWVSRYRGEGLGGIARSQLAAPSAASAGRLWLVIAEVERLRRQRYTDQEAQPNCAVTATVSRILTADIIALATEYGRYGYRRIAAMLRDAGWVVNDKRIERIWRREGLKVPQKQPKRGRLWLNDGSCIRLRPETRTMSGPTTSSRIAPTTGRSTACSTSSMSSRANAWRSE